MMNARRLALLNAGILTVYGTFSYEAITLGEARDLVKRFASEGQEIISAIGHGATADLLSDQFDYRVEKNRIEFRQSIGDIAIIFKLLSRPAEGTILTRAELERIGYEFALLTRIA